MISIHWGTKIISVPQSYLTFISGTLYELDTDQFRLDLKALEAGENGMPFPDTHRHNTEVTVAGTTFARTIEILSPYKVEFEDGQYSVRLAGSNNNIFDVEGGILMQNQVQIISNNSAGLIVSTGGVSAGDIQNIVDGVWDALLVNHTVAGSMGEAMNDQVTQLLELWQILGLDSANPLTMEETQHTVGGITLDITCNPDGSVTIARQ